MPSVIDWASLGSEMDKNSQGEGGNGDRVPFLKYQKDKTHIVRPIGKAVRFYKIFANGKSRIIDLEQRSAAEKILSEAKGEEVKLQNRFAMFVIDREDGNVKILEGSYTMMESFAKWSSLNGVSPGAKEGGDWSITVTGSGWGGKNPRRYKTGFLRPSALTSEELTMLKEKGDKLKLEEIFIAISLDELVEFADKEFAGKQSADMETESVSSPAPAPAPATESPVASNPLW